MALRYCDRTCQHGANVDAVYTHVGLDVEVLEVERVLPDVDADDGHVRQKRVLVSRGDNLQSLQGGVVALRDGHA